MTCSSDRNAENYFLISRPSHLLDEDSQSSVKSSTNDSSKLKKSKFADLFDRYNSFKLNIVLYLTRDPSGFTGFGIYGFSQHACIIYYVLYIHINLSLKSLHS